MKKIILSAAIIFLLTGCFNSNPNYTEKVHDPEYSLCKNMEKIEVSNDIKTMPDLTKKLENLYKIYCKKTDSEICNSINETIVESKKEIKYENCNRTDPWWNSNWEDLCKSSNELEEQQKIIDVDDKLYKVQDKCEPVIDKVEYPDK